MSLRSLVILSSASLLSQAVLAQQSPQTNEQTAKTRAGIEEVVVTAQRRAQNLQEVPMSVTALSAEKLQEAGVVNTADLARVIPGLIMATYSNNLQPAIRGISASGANVGDNPSVAMYLDGVYQAQQVATLIDLPDIEQIEVLKGPQGTLYGQNATGGAITIKTRSPSFTPTGDFSASYGNYDARDVRAFVSAPITDSVAWSLAAAYQNRDGFRRQIVTGEHDSGLESSTVRGKMLLKPADWADITLSAYYSNRKDSSAFAVSALDNNSAGYNVNPSAPRVTSVGRFGADPDVFSRVKAKGFSALGEFSLDAGTLTVSSAYADSRVSAFSDLDASPVNFSTYTWDTLDTNTSVTEATFASRDFGPLNFLAGALYMQSEDCFCEGIFFAGTGNVVPDPMINVFQVTGTGKIEKDIGAAYAEVNFNVTDDLTLTAGGRYTKEEQRGAASQNLGVPPVPKLPRVKYKEDPIEWDEFTPRFVARYKINPDHTVYASYTEGFKGGLINASNINQDAVDPESIKSYEVGYKGRLTSDLTANAAAFYYEYDNLQVVSFLSGSNYITQNAASASGQGVELDISWAATSELSFTGGLAYLDTEYDDYKQANSLTPNTPSPTNPNAYTALNIDRTGDNLIRAPQLSASLSAKYSTFIEAGEIGANASLYYTDDYTLDPLGLVEQGSYTTLNVDLSFVPASMQSLRLVLWGKNLTDEEYLSQANPSEASIQIAWADPRTFGVRAEYKF